MPEKKAVSEHDTGCECCRCVVAFEPMAVALHRLYTADPDKAAP